MGANDRASTTLVRMEGKKNRPPLARLAQWMAIEVSDHSKLIFFSNNVGKMLHSHIRLISHELEHPEGSFWAQMNKQVPH